MKTPQLQTAGLKQTSFGEALYVKISTPDYQELSWEEIYSTLQGVYPHRWAVQFYPPEDYLVDEVSLYHLYILGGEPKGIDWEKLSSLRIVGLNNKKDAGFTWPQEWKLFQDRFPGRWGVGLFPAKSSVTDRSLQTKFSHCIYLLKEAPVGIDIYQKNHNHAV